MRVFLLATWSLIALTVGLGVLGDLLNGHLGYGYLIAVAVIFVLLKIILAAYPFGSRAQNTRSLIFWCGWIILIISVAIFSHAYDVVISGNYLMTAHSRRGQAVAAVINFIGDTFGANGAALAFSLFGFAVASLGIVMVTKNLTTRSRGDGLQPRP
jgi:hypothetical protein